MKPIHAIIANVTERIQDDEYPALQVYVPYDNRWGNAFYSDPIAASRMGLHDVKIQTPDGVKSEKDGVEFVRNLWRHFAGNSEIICDPPADGYIFDTKHEEAEE